MRSFLLIKLGTKGRPSYVAAQGWLCWVNFRTQKYCYLRQIELFHVIRGGRGNRSRSAAWSPRSTRDTEVSGTSFSAQDRAAAGEAAKYRAVRFIRTEVLRLLMLVSPALLSESQEEHPIWKIVESSPRKYIIRRALECSSTPAAASIVPVVEESARELFAAAVPRTLVPRARQTSVTSRARVSKIVEHYRGVKNSGAIRQGRDRANESARDTGLGAIFVEV